MTRRYSWSSRLLSALAVVVLGTAGQVAVAQEADPVPVPPDTALKFPNTIAGEFTPSYGFDIIRTKRGSLNISFYGLFRYVNQISRDTTFLDHRGVAREFNARNDLNWHRGMIWLTGFFWDNRFRYNVTTWGLATTQQTLVFGNLQFRASKHFVFGVGIAPTLSARSLQGSWPYWASSDRQMAEEFFRGGFSSGFWVTGEVVPRLFYNLTINNNLSQLGTTQANDTRDMAYSGMLRWQPTTGEFGPRNGFGDFEYHTKVATQFGVSSAKSRESRYAPIGSPPNATQIKLSDGVNPFEEGAFADSVTVKSLNYRVLGLDAGVKYRGFSWQSEYYWRQLSDFVATDFVPRESLYDHGFMAEASYMVLQRKLGLYVAGGYIWDEFNRQPWELGGGANYYPSGTRALRMNLHVMHVNQSPVNSFFSFYLAGFTGTLLSLGVDFLL